VEFTHGISIKSIFLPMQIGSFFSTLSLQDQARNYKKCAKNACLQNIAFGISSFYLSCMIARLRCITLANQDFALLVTKKLQTNGYKKNLKCFLLPLGSISPLPCQVFYGIFFESTDI